MDKWAYIELISKKDMLLDLLNWARVTNTMQITIEQAKFFYELFLEDPCIC